MDLRNYINREVGSFLKQSRIKRGVSATHARAYIGYEIEEIEEGRKSIPCCDLVGLTEFYNIPYGETSEWFFNLQMNVYQRKQKPPDLST